MKKMTVVENVFLDLHVRLKRFESTKFKKFQQMFVAMLNWQVKVLVKIEIW